MPKRYTEEFERETVRLALTSGRLQSSIFQDLGVSRTTLVRWLAKHREGEGAAAVPADDDIIAQLRRLRRENGFSGRSANRRSAQPHPEEGHGFLRPRGKPMKWRFRRTTDSQHAWPIAPNLLKQNLTATQQN